LPFLKTAAFVQFTAGFFPGVEKAVLALCVRQVISVPAFNDSRVAAHRAVLRFVVDIEKAAVPV
jgi:hypothetical protein